MRNPWDECEFAATIAGDLKRPNKSLHWLLRCPCDKCEYAATKLSRLKIHIEIKHEGVKYPSYRWEYAATKQVIWRIMLRVNIKEWDILVTDVNTLQLK